MVSSDKTKFQRFLENRKDLKQRTIEEYKKCIKIVPIRLLQKRSIPAIRKYFEKQNQARKTVAQRLSVCRSFFKFCKVKFTDERYVTHSRNISLKEAFNRDEVKKLIENCEDIFTKSIIIFLVKTGLRISELLNCQMWLSDDKSSIFIRFLGKGRWTFDTLSISSESMQDCYDIFIGSDVRQRIYKNIYKHFMQSKSKSKIDNKKKTIHSLRHSFAIFQKEAGASSIDIQYMLRHKDLETTQIYLFENQNIIQIKNIHI